MSHVGKAPLLLIFLLSAAPSRAGSPIIHAGDLENRARAASLAAGRVPSRFAGILSEDQFRALEARVSSPARTLGTATDVEGAWQPGFGLPILNEYPGVAIEFRGELVVAGWLRAAGNYRVNGIARWTSNGWAPLGNGVDPGQALAVWNDRLYAASWFATVSSWDGQTWTPLPSSPFSTINSLEVIGGVLVAAGTSDYTHGRVATFNGQGWSVLGGDFDQYATALGSYQGDIVAGGAFAANGATTLNRIARWDGTSWVPLGNGVDPDPNTLVGAIQEFGGRLFVAGSFSSCSGIYARGLAAWDGQNWSRAFGV